MFVDIVENGKGFSDADKLLICLAIILLLTIVWTILIGIMCRMRNNTTVVKKNNKFLLDEDDDDDEIVVTSSRIASGTSSSKYKAKRAKKTTTKKAKKTKRTTKRSNTRSASRTNRVVSSSSNQEVYVKVKFYGTNKNLIYVAPENVILRKGEKVKVRTDEGNIRTATVTQGNYLREKYKTYEYQTLDLVD